MSGIIRSGGRGWEPASSAPPRVILMPSKVWAPPWPSVYGAPPTVQQGPTVRSRESGLRPGGNATRTLGIKAWLSQRHTPFRVVRFQRYTRDKASYSEPSLIKTSNKNENQTHPPPHLFITHCVTCDVWRPHDNYCCCLLLISFLVFCFLGVYRAIFLRCAL